MSSDRFEIIIDAKDQASKKIRDVIAPAKDLSKALVSVNSAATGVAAALRKLNEAISNGLPGIKDFGKASSVLNTNLRGIAGNVDKIANSIAALNEKTNAAAGGLENLSRSSDSVIVSLHSISRHARTNISDLVALGTGVNSLGKEFGSLIGTIDKVPKKLQRLLEVINGLNNTAGGNTKGDVNSLADKLERAKIPADALAKELISVNSAATNVSATIQTLTSNISNALVVFQGMNKVSKELADNLKDIGTASNRAIDRVTNQARARGGISARDKAFAAELNDIGIYEEKARKEQEKLEAQKKREADRAAKEKAAQEEKARKESIRAAREQAAQEERIRREAARAAREQAAQEERTRREAARAAREQAAQEERARREAARAAREQAAQEERVRREAARAAREQAAQEERARRDAERAAREQAAQEERARRDAERAAREQAAQEERARRDAERAAREQAAQENRERRAAEKEERRRQREEEDTRRKTNGGVFEGMKDVVSNLWAIIGYIHLAQQAFVAFRELLVEPFNMYAADKEIRSISEILLQSTADAKNAFIDANKFASKYYYSVLEVNQSVYESAQLLKLSNKGADELLSSLARLASINPAQGFSGATFALKEAALGGDIVSMVERFNIARRDAIEIRDAISAGVDPVDALNRVLDRMGVTTDVLAQRTESALAAQREFTAELERFKVIVGEKLEKPLGLMYGVGMNVAHGVFAGDFIEQKVSTTPLVSEAQKKINEYEEIIAKLRAAPGNRETIAELEKAKAALEQRIKETTAAARGMFEDPKAVGTYLDTLDRQFINPEKYRRKFEEESQRLLSAFQGAPDPSKYRSLIPDKTPTIEEIKAFQREGARGRINRAAKEEVSSVEDKLQEKAREEAIADAKALAKAWREQGDAGLIASYQAARSTDAIKLLAAAYYEAGDAIEETAESQAKLRYEDFLRTDKERLEILQQEVAALERAGKETDTYYEKKLDLLQLQKKLSDEEKRKAEEVAQAKKTWVDSRKSDEVLLAEARARVMRSSANPLKKTPEFYQDLMLIDKLEKKIADEKEAKANALHRAQRDYYYDQATDLERLKMLQEELAAIPKGTAEEWEKKRDIAALQREIEADNLRAQEEAAREQERLEKKRLREAEQYAREQEKIYQAKLDYELELLDIQGKIARWKKELERVPEGSVEYYNIKKKIVELEEKATEELKKQRKEAINLAQALNKLRQDELQEQDRILQAHRIMSGVRIDERFKEMAALKIEEFNLRRQELLGNTEGVVKPLPVTTPSKPSATLVSRPTLSPRDIRRTASENYVVLSPGSIQVYVDNVKTDARVVTTLRQSLNEIAAQGVPDKLF